MTDEPLEHFGTCNIRLPSPAGEPRKASISPKAEIGMGLLDRLQQWDQVSSPHPKKNPFKAPPPAQRTTSDHSMHTLSTSSSTRSGTSAAARWASAASASSPSPRPRGKVGRLRIREAPLSPKPAAASRCEDDAESVTSEAWTAITDRLDHWDKATHHHGSGHSVASDKRAPGKLRFSQEPKYAYQRKAAAAAQNQGAPFGLVITTNAAPRASSVGAGLSERLDQWGKAAATKADYSPTPRRTPGRLMIREAPRETIPEEPVEDFGAGLSERLATWNKATHDQTNKKKKKIRRNGKKSPKPTKKKAVIPSLSFPGMVALEEDSDSDSDDTKIAPDQIGAGLSERLGAWGKAANKSREVHVSVATRKTPGRLMIHEAPKPPVEEDTREQDSWENLQQKLDQWNKAATTSIDHYSSAAAPRRTPGRLMIHEAPRPVRH